MIRVVLPAHLRLLSKTSSEVQLNVEGVVTVNAVLDALEKSYPMLSGTIRDHVTRVLQVGRVQVEAQRAAAEHAPGADQRGREGALQRTGRAHAESRREQAPVAHGCRRVRVTGLRRQCPHRS